MFTRVLVLLFCALAAVPAGAASVCRAIDGDTIACGRERVRILNIDTPELGSHARCAIEADLAEQARQMTAARLASGQVEIRPDAKRPRDRYGRTLAWVLVDGRDLGDELVAAGLARPWTGRRRPWCP
ncbi:MAG: thermonuclease family protein [Alphaproteobacteria bacterium]|nr:thermonuclease family protein [Alphaproteobacteria bacterium]